MSNFLIPAVLIFPGLSRDLNQFVETRQIVNEFLWSVANCVDLGSISSATDEKNDPNNNMHSLIACNLS